VIGIATIGAFIFIYYTNDHRECENIVELAIGDNGEQVSTEQHICKERFNF
jgi:hypothetical protein